jgi:hypothetical protein
MSKRSITVLINHCHKLLDPISYTVEQCVFLYKLCVKWEQAIIARGNFP